MRILLFLLLIPSICFGDSELTIGGRTGAAHIIQSNGVSLRPRPYLDFESGINCIDLGGKSVCDGGLTSVPDFSNQPCTPGQYSADASYFYICQSDNTWLRTAISTFTSNSNNYLTFRGNFLTFNGSYLTF